MPNLRGSEWLIILLLVVLLFGAKRLPDAARSVGRSLRIFKAETKGLAGDEPAAKDGQAASSAPAEITSSASAQAAPLPGAAEQAAEPQPQGQQPHQS